MEPVHIIHLYPKEMNIYGDNGNLLVLDQRLNWRDIPVVVHPVGVGDKLPSKVHFILGGGGQDKGQSVIAADLQSKARQLKDLANSGVPMLMICGMYQMFGHYFKTASGDKIPGIGLLDIYTVAEQGRLIGNIVVDSKDFKQIVGYENHSGRTYLNNGAKPLGFTKKNQGNNGKDLTEGAVWNNVYGSYLHGPLLAKAPNFTDYLLKLSLITAGLDKILLDLGNDEEQAAALTAKMRPR